VNVAVRLATPEDAPALARLMRDVYDEFGEQPPATPLVVAFFRERLAPGGGLDAFLAEDGEGACGLLTLAFAPTTLQLARFAWLDDLHVAPSRRGRGVGALLLAAASAHAVARGAVEIRLSTGPEPGLARLYREAGFRPSSLGLHVLHLGDEAAS
jgi:GNAT superfamily N-acetyltransferase